MTSAAEFTQLTLVMTSLMMSVIFYLAWKSLGQRLYVLNWSIAFFASAIYWFLIMIPEEFPNLESNWLLANAFGFMLVTLGLEGHCKRTNCQYLPKTLWPYAGLFFAVLVWFTVVRPHAGLSVSILPLVSALTLLLSALIVLQHREQPRIAEWAAAIMMIVFAISHVAAASQFIDRNDGLAAVFAEMYQHPTFPVMPVGLMGISMFVILMLASDVSEEMKEMAVQDQLTGLLNRRGLSEQGARAYATARRTFRPVSVIMTDIDHFKEVNDEFGHSAGDAALVHFAELLKTDRRVDDVVARIGGEEFILVLPGAKLEKCIDIADELRESMQTSPLVVEDRAVQMTASFGVATISSKDTCLTDIIVRADRALYRSKRAGRNRVDLESSQLMRAADGTLKSVS